MIKGACRIAYVSFTAIIFVTLDLASSLTPGIAQKLEAGRAERPAPSTFADLKDFPAVMLFMHEKYKEAEKAFESDLDRTWRDPEAAYCYGSTLTELGKTAAAIKVWKRICQQYPQSEAARAARNKIVPEALDPDSDIGIIGLRFVAKQGQPAEITGICPGSPAERSHLQARDFIMGVDDIPTSTFTSAEMAACIRGAPDTRVTLTIKRGNTTFKKILTRMHSKEFARSHPDLWKKYSEPEHER